MIRLQKYLRDMLGFSRRKAEEYIAAGQVRVNDSTAQLGMSVDPQKDEILFQGKKVLPKKLELVYIMLHKPQGFVTTRSDPQERRTVFYLLPKNMQQLFPVGRLDYNTEGLLLLTNDGDFAYRLTHPKFEVEKEYLVTIDGALRPEEKNRIEAGLKTKDLQTGKMKIRILSSQPKKTALLITLHEGQKREIRRIFEHFGYRVMDLKRIRLGKLLLGDLPKGKWRTLAPREIGSLRDSK